MSLDSFLIQLSGHTDGSPSLVGIWYGTLYTPTKNPAVYTTRTGISGWADRVGAFAFALTPFAVLLGMRESLLSLMTGVPHQHFMFLHRWLGRLILVQSILHTIGWIVIETRLYQPQPTQWINFVAEEYIIFGFAALGVLVVLWLLSTKTAIRWLGYELFRLTHGLIALAYIALCWGHWPQLACWLIASIILIGLDQVARFIGFLYIHTSAKHSNGGPLFQPANAQVTVFRNPSASEKGDEDTLVRLDFDLDHRQAWSAGQHFFLTFPQLSLFQTHPFTVASLPSEGNAPHHHTYLIRAQKGQTVHLANHETLTTVLSRPYGRKFIRPSESPRHLLAVAGGSGVTFTLPLVLASLQQQKQQPVSAPVATSFIWVVRAARDLLWIAPELAQLKAALAEHPGLTIAIYITREAKGVNGNNSDAGSEADSPLHEKTHADITVAAAHDAETSSTEADVTEKRSSASSSSSSRTSLSALLAPAPRFSVTYLAGQHPVLLDVVAAFRDRVSEAAGAAAAAGDDAGTEVVGSGPPEMGTDLRVAVAEGARSVSSERFYWDARE